VGKDIFIKLDRCSYCGRPGFVSWDVDLFSCTREVCKALAYGEVKRRAHAGNGKPEKKLERALVNALTTFEHELRLDRDAELLAPTAARRMDEHEREETSRVIGQLHELLRPHRVR
jgi:hypothetical protein